MTTALDSLIRPIAKSVIATYGKTVVYRRHAAKAYSRATGITTDGAATDYTIKCSPPAPFAKEYVDGSNVLMGDLTTIVAATELSVTPDQTKDRFVIDGEEWRIIGHKPIHSGDQPAAYRFHLRQ